jgi:YfiH family protein
MNATSGVTDLSFQTKNGIISADNICVPHGFTTREGGASTGIFSSMNIAMHRGDCAENVIKNYEILAERIGFDVKNLVLTRQTHSDIIRVVTKADARGLDHHGYPECDALITNDAGCALVVFTADCTPILLWDSVTGAVGAVHAGWRGTAADIAGKTISAMVSEFGCKAENIRAAIGPNIGFCCFETDRDVPDTVIAAAEAVAAADNPPDPVRRPAESPDYVAYLHQHIDHLTRLLELAITKGASS